jgi:hypothetical protein
MSNQEQHEMQLEKVHPSGAEEWFCPTCGRRFLMHWKPEQEKLDLDVIISGDLQVSHVGSKDGFRITKVAIVDDEPKLSDELRAALEEALQDVDFDDWPDATHN